MDASRRLWEKLKERRLIALLSPATAEACVQAYELFEPLGVVLEIALRTDAALTGIAAIRHKHPDALLLAGTVMTDVQVEEAVSAGATGIVSPDYLEPVVRACVERDVMCVPGGSGDVGKQLVQKADLYACSLAELRTRYPYQWIHKLFPAASGGATLGDVGKSWQGVYPGLMVVYTGGVTTENAGQILEHDPAAILCGSALTRRIEEAEFTRKETQHWLEVIHGLKTAAIENRPKSETARVAPSTGGQSAVVTFGEIMLRLSPPMGKRFSQATSFDACYGGAEANVAAALAQWGNAARFVTAVPDQPMGWAALNTLRTHGVDTAHALRQGKRLGLYYLEQGAAQRPSQVIYDRANSAISEVTPGQVDWDTAYHGADWLHLTGITPALSASTAKVTREAVEKAKQAGMTVSIDLNYRAKLWPADRAREVLTSLMPFVDVVIGNEEDAAKVFGLHAEGTDVTGGKLDAEAYRSVAEEMLKRFELKAVAITLRESLSASDNRWSACLYDENEFYVSRSYAIHVVDRVGAGDAFAAGLIHAMRAGRQSREALEFATAASCLKHTIPGDFNLATVAEVEALVAGSATGRIQR